MNRKEEYGIDTANASPRGRRDPPQSQGNPLLDRHRALLPGDGLHRLVHAGGPAGRAQAIARLGFPPYFRIELAWAKLIGVVVLLAPAPARLKEWAYAGFAINLASALIAHLSMGDGPDALAPSAVTGVLWTLSYFFWRRREATRSVQADAERRSN